MTTGIEDQLSELMLRLQRLEDERDIRDLCSRYCHLADNRRWTELGELFDDDAVFVGLRQATGREDILRFLTEEFSTALDDWTHFYHTQSIEIEGDTANGRARFDAPCVLNGIPMICTGFYVDHFVKRNGKWLFASRRLDFQNFCPLSEGWGNSST